MILQKVSQVRLFGVRQALLPLLLAGFGGVCGAQVNVTTYQNDISRTGQNLSETILTPSNVNATQFGKLFSHTVDGQVYAQPLYLSNVTINGLQHNVIFVATENDSVYAFDADNNGGVNANPLWQAPLLSTAYGAAAGAVAFPASELAGDITPLVGITGTPVIDPSTGTLYVVSKSMESGGQAIQRLHALDVTTGKEKFGGPVVITATVNGTGNGSSGGKLVFDSEWENQRPGLLLLNGTVYIAFAAHGDNGPWHGWVLGYNAKTLQQTGIFNASPNGVGSGIWMSGAALAAEVQDANHPYGRMFIATGNGDYTGAIPYASGMDFGDSILNLDLTNGVPTITDEFTPYNQADLDAEDGDLGSGGVLLLPTQSGSVPHLLVETGKSGTVYLVNRDNMSGYHGTDQVVQEIPYGAGLVGVWSNAAYWNGNVYYWGRLDHLKSFQLTNGQLGTVTQSSETYGFPGATPSISANGNTQGILWSIDSEAYATGGNQLLQAHDASNVATTLYSSGTNATRDNPGGAVKFAVPTIANGKVYVGAAGQISVFGLLNGTQQAATPVLNPGTEVFNGSISVTMTDATPGATIYYTTNGTQPTTSSTPYTGPITVSATETIYAIASASNYLVSPVASATYTNTTQAVPPVFSPTPGGYTSAQTVTISDATAGAMIYYTTDGSTPTTSSAKYTGPITVSSTETLSAMATASGLQNSQVTKGTYTIQTPGSGINFTQGFASSTGLLILNGSTQLDDSRLQLTDGGQYEAGTAWFVNPINIQAFTTDFSFQLSNPVADGITFTIQNAGINAVGAAAGDLGYGYMAKSVAIKFDLFNNSGEGPDSTGLYTNGTPPIVPAIDLTASGIDLHSDDTMLVHLVYDGTNLAMTITDNVTKAVFSTSFAVNIPSIVGGNTAYVGFTGGTGYSTSSQKILTWTYSNSPVAAAPTFSPAAGSYSSAQTVTISDTTAGATIYYTKDGSTPTTSSIKYTGPIAVNASETINAIATAANYNNSAVASAQYTINAVLPAPAFSPAGGTFASTQSVTISESVTGAAIYYTTNGSTPTTSSTKYTGPITVSATETIQAIAAASGYSNSAVAAANYTISTPPPTPTFSPAGGTYTSAQSVTISDAAAGAAIYYTTNGSAPTASSTKYTGAIAVGATETIEAIAVTAAGSSPVATAAYTIQAAGGTGINFGSGFTGSQGQITLNGNTQLTGSQLQLTDGGQYEAGTAWYVNPVNVQTFTTDFSFQLLNATADGMTFTIQNAGVNAVGAAAGDLGYGYMPNSVAIKFDLFDNSGEGPDSTGLFTNGTPPMTPAVDLRPSGVDLHSGDTMLVHLAYDGTNLSMTITDSVTKAVFSTSFAVNIPAIVGGNTAYMGFTGGTGYSTATQKILTWTYGSTPVTATPVFSPAGGTYSTAQTVSISDATTGATIYYTTNGTTPTASSTKYAAPIAVNATETIKAIAVQTGYTASAVATASYTLNTMVATPTFSPSGGAYTSAQSVTISDATAGATIYYTTNGTTPTASSTKYAGPITVSATETIEAIAVAGSGSSAVATASYTLNTVVATPTFSPSAGIYTSAQSVTISDTTAGATIYYTTNGTTPTASSTKYAGPITVSATETIEAIAVTGSGSSAVATASYTIQAGSGTGINFGSGFAGSQGKITLNGSAQLVGSGVQLTGQTQYQAGAVWSASPVNVQSFTTDFNFQLTNAVADGMTFAIQNAGSSAVGAAAGNLGYGYMPSSVAVKFDLFDNSGEGPDSTGLYVGGNPPITPAVDMSSSGVNLHSGDILHAHLVYNGTTLSMTVTDTVTNATFSTSFTANIPSAVGGNTAYVGFTGGTGYSMATQTILNWTYSTP